LEDNNECHDTNIDLAIRIKLKGGI
jgi:hypothetical protein